MSLLDRLEDLRARPEAERRRLLLWSTTLITLIIFIIWLANWRYLHSGGVNWTNISANESSPSSALQRIRAGWQTLLNIYGRE